MPFYFNVVDDFPEVAHCKSVLIIPCLFCPAACLSVKENEPYIALFRKFPKTASYERLIGSVKLNLEKRGIKTDIFKSKLIHQYVLCMWTTKRRAKLLKYAAKYEAALVMGCKAAVETVSDTLKSTDCKVYEGMETVGLMNVTPKIHLPFNISLELVSITSSSHHSKYPEKREG